METYQGLESAFVETRTFSFDGIRTKNKKAILLNDNLYLVHKSKLNQSRKTRLLIQTNEEIRFYDRFICDLYSCKSCYKNKL